MDRAIKRLLKWNVFKLISVIWLRIGEYIIDYKVYYIKFQPSIRTVTYDKIRRN